MAIAVHAPTVDDLMRLGSDARVEIVNGEIIDMAPVGGRHAFIVDRLFLLIHPTVSQNKLGYLFTDSPIYILEEAEGVRLARVPDVSFVRKEAIPKDWDIERPFPGAPTLAVEVMSPDDQFEKVIEKVTEYFGAGTEEVWIVLPRQKSIFRHRRGESVVQTYGETDVMDAEPLFPGLSLSLRDIFTLPDLS